MLVSRAPKFYARRWSQILNIFYLVRFIKQDLELKNLGQNINLGFQNDAADEDGDVCLSCYERSFLEVQNEK